MNISPFLFIGLIFFSTVLRAQTTLTGSIKEASGKAMPFVEVSLLNTRYKTFTDSAGKFQFTNVPAGKYTLHADIPGYAGIYKTVEGADSLQELNIIWQPLRESLEGVVVSAERTQSLSQKVPLSLTALPAKKIEEYRIWTTTDLTAVSSNLYRR